MEQYVIHTADLGKRFGTVQALTALNLKVPQSAIFGFLGPNGAGKTTTMKLLMGLIRPTDGSGTIFGKDIVRDNLEIRSRIGYLPQHPHFYEEMSARETLRFTASFFFEGPKSKIEDRINEMLNLVGLEQKANRAVKGFSGGERQRLGIAQAQMNYPDLLILDEPAAALDPIGRHQVLQIMEKLRHYSTIFYSTHILDDVQQVSDTVAIMNQGTLLVQGPIDEMLNGGGRTVYNISLKGNADTLGRQVEMQSWVEKVHVGYQNGSTQWQVTVNDEDAAEQQLFRLLASDQQSVVTEFGRKKYELEEVFIKTIQGGSNER